MQTNFAGVHRSSSLFTAESVSFRLAIAKSYFITFARSMAIKSAKRTLEILLAQISTLTSRIINFFHHVVVIEYIITCKVLNGHDTHRKKLNVVDILVSLNFMHMKMCSSFFLLLSIVAMGNSSSFGVIRLRFLLRIRWHSNYFDFWSPFDPWKTIFSNAVVWLIILMGFQLGSLFLDSSPGKWKIHKRKIRENCFSARERKAGRRKDLFSRESSFDLQKIVVALPGKRFQRLLLRSKVRLADAKSWLRRARFSAPRQRENKFSGN